MYINSNIRCLNVGRKRNSTESVNYYYVYFGGGGGVTTNFDFTNLQNESYVKILTVYKIYFFFYKNEKTFSFYTTLYINKNFLKSILYFYFWFRESHMTYESRYGYPWYIIYFGDSNKS